MNFSAWNWIRLGSLVLDLQGAVPNHDGRLFLLLAGEAEVVDGLKSCRLPRLERESQP